MKTTGARSIILARLRSGDWIRGRELRDTTCPDASMNAVRQAISDLRAAGHEIEAEQRGRASRGYRLAREATGHAA